MFLETQSYEKTQTYFAPKLTTFTETGKNIYKIQNTDDAAANIRPHAALDTGLKAKKERSRSQAAKDAGDKRVDPPGCIDSFASLCEDELLQQIQRRRHRNRRKKGSKRPAAKAMIKFPRYDFHGNAFDIQNTTATSSKPEEMYFHRRRQKKHAKDRKFLMTEALRNKCLFQDDDFPELVTTENSRNDDYPKERVFDKKKTPGSKLTKQHLDVDNEPDSTVAHLAHLAHLANLADKDSTVDTNPNINPANVHAMTAKYIRSPTTPTTFMDIRQGDTETASIEPVTNDRILSEIRLTIAAEIAKNMSEFKMVICEQIFSHINSLKIYNDEGRSEFSVGTIDLCQDKLNENENAFSASYESDWSETFLSKISDSDEEDDFNSSPKPNYDETKMLGLLPRNLFECS